MKRKIDEEQHRHIVEEHLVKKLVSHKKQVVSHRISKTVTVEIKKGKNKWLLS